MNGSDPVGLLAQNCQGPEVFSGWYGNSKLLGSEICLDIDGVPGTTYVNYMMAFFEEFSPLPLKGHLEIQGPDGQAVPNGNGIDSKGAAFITVQFGTNVAPGWYYAIYWWEVVPGRYFRYTSAGLKVTGCPIDFEPITGVPA